MPVFSIIIPTYNSASTIKECLDSIFIQTFSDFEIILMDGISGDTTLDIARSYNDDRLKIFSEKDKGVYDAMNKAIDKSSGSWLHFLGSDDTLYDEDVLKNIYGFIHNNSSDIVYGNAYFIGRKYFHDGEFSRLKLATEKNICHQALFYNKSVFARLGNYNLDFPINADWDFNLRCFATPDLKITFIDLPIVNYNDMSGLSDSHLVDTNFQAFSVIKLSYEVKRLKGIINQREEYIKHIESSNSYLLGKFLLSPLRLVKKIIQSIKK